MPSLFSLPGPRVGADNFFSQYTLGYGEVYTVASGTNLYSSLFRVLWADHDFGSLVNNGTIWNITQSDSSIVFVGFNVTQITNTGLIVSEALDGNAYGVSVLSSGNGVENSGSIYAIANGISTAVEHWDPNAVIHNSGLIAAYSQNPSIAGVAGATGVAMFNGGVLTNDAGASILAEGQYATAILFGRGSLFYGYSSIQNDGRIEAVTTLAGEPSYGIRTGGEPPEFIVLNNTGTIKADIAWSSYGTHPLYAAKGMDRLTNASTGVIEGRIETGRGEDVLINQGTIVGDVAMGDEDDILDTSAGTLVGAVDMGWNDDVFIGSAGNDVVNGNRGSDNLTGNAGNDLLLGGVGDDVLVGGSGNDGLYGEVGDDQLLTEGGDRAFGGDGNDSITVGDLSFAFVDGGNGTDTLWFNVNGMKLNLHSALATGRLGSFEKIGLHDGQQLAISAGDATSIAGGPLEIFGGNGDSVALVGAWVEGSQAIRDGAAYRSFTLGGETVYVLASMGLSIVGSTPAGFTGLASIAGGAAAPQAGSVHGGDFSNPVLEISQYTDRAIRIDAGETWHSTNATVIDGHSFNPLVNYGTIELENASSGYYIHAVQGDFGGIDNYGTIRAIGSNGYFVDAIEARGNLVNWGTIEAVSDSGWARAAQINSLGDGPTIENHGVISGRSTTGKAVGAIVATSSTEPYGLSGSNAGLIEAIGGAGSVALSILVPGSFINSGTIAASNTAASGATDAVAVQLWNNYGYDVTNQLVNSGVINGPIAIRSDFGNDDIVNSGQIVGAVQLNDGTDIVYNLGAITGLVSLGTENDAYLGAGATTAAHVNGGDGADLLLGGNLADQLEGGSGNDVLVGGGSADTLTGGAGADRFVYLSATDSTALATDLIQDFESGVDRLDLSHLSPSSVSLSASNGITTVTAITASGTVVIHVNGNVSLSDIDTTLPLIQTGTDGDDIMLAGTGANDLRGGNGDDVLLGTGGADILNGGAGGDVMIGGTGDDVYYVDSYLDHVIEREGGGVDLILGQGTVVLPDFVENLTLLGAGQGIGNSLDNIIRGSSGSDGLSGGDGDDVLIGGGGGDYMSGGMGVDRFVYESVSDSTASAYDTIGGFTYGVDKIDLSGLQVLSISWVRITDTFNNYDDVTIQTADGAMRIRVTGTLSPPFGLSLSDFIVKPANLHLVGSANADVLNGDAGDDLIEGLGGDDFLRGFAGNDTLNGGAGLDKMYGGLGDDTYIVTDITDYAYEYAGEGHDLVQSSVSLTLRANVEDLTLTGSGSIWGKGNELDNVLTGNSGSNKLYGFDGNDTLTGGSGNDKLTGGNGADQLYGGTGDDFYYITDALDTVHENSGEGTDRLYSSIDYVLDANVEWLYLTGSASIDGTGNAGGNFIYGNEGDNVLLGMGGSDRLYGYGGNDRLDGGLGSLDRMYGGAGDDIYYAHDATDYAYENVGEGHDTVYADVSYTLRVNVEDLVLTGSANNYARGNASDNGLTGNAGDNKLYGYGGNDTVDGGAGNDWLEGGSGQDLFTGGTGADVFVFRDGDFAGMSEGTADRILDFSQAEGDKLRLNIVDANTTLGGDQAFAFIGTTAFHGIAGELRYEQLGGNTYVMGDTNGDGNADFWIRLDGLHTLGNSDFVL